MSFNEIKIKDFYKNIIIKFDGNELHFKNEIDFIKCIKESQRSTDGSKVTTTTETGIQIIFSNFIFKQCFCDELPPHTDYNFFHLIEAKNCSVKQEDFSYKVYNFFDNKGNEISKLLLYNGEEEYEQITEIYLFENNVKLINPTFSFHGGNNIFFRNFFIPINFFLQIKKYAKKKEQVLYQLASIGIVETDIDRKTIALTKSINNLTPQSSNTITLKQSSHNSYKFYISAIKNDNIFYQFLDLYHVIESFFNKELKRTLKQIQKGKLNRYFKLTDKKIEQIKLAEEANLKIVLSNLDLKKRELFNEFKSIKQNDLAKVISGLTNVQISSLSNTFLLDLSSFIYKIRNAIVHSKDEKQYIKNLITGKNIENFKNINKFMFYLIECLFECYEQ